MTNLERKHFEFIGNVENSDKIEGKSLSFWADATVRLLKMKASVVSMIILGIIIIFAIVVPMTSPYSAIKPVTQDVNLVMVKSLPPRVPILEKTGIADGKETKVVTESDLKNYDANEYTVKEVNKSITGKTNYTIDVDLYKAAGLNDTYFILGTDDLGRDIWTRVWSGTGISLIIGLSSAIINLFIGVVYGGIAGYYGGTKIDNLLMRSAEIISGIPTLVWVILMSLVMKPGMGTILVALAISSWIGTAQIVRAQFLKLKDQEFVLAATTVGANPYRIIVKHLFPNVIGQIVILLTIMIPGAIFYEAFLAFIGLGLPKPTPSLGIIINDARTYMESAPEYILAPTLILSAIMLCIQLLSNGLRDALDPRMRNQ